MSNLIRLFYSLNLNELFLIYLYFSYIFIFISILSILSMDTLLKYDLFSRRDIYFKVVFKNVENFLSHLKRKLNLFYWVKVESLKVGNKVPYTTKNFHWIRFSHLRTMDSYNGLSNIDIRSCVLRLIVYVGIY